MNYNPYFPGGAISMPRVIFDGLVEYDDGMCYLIIFAFCRRLMFLCRHSRDDLTNGQGCYYFPELGS
jgi:hypothetical protein